MHSLQRVMRGGSPLRERCTFWGDSYLPGVTPGPGIAFCGSGRNAVAICDEGCACAAEYCYTLTSR